MKSKHLFLIAAAISGIYTLYLSFDAPAVIKLWSWFGYTYSIGNPLDNGISKLVTGIFIGLWIMDPFKKKNIKDDN